MELKSLIVRKQQATGLWIFDHPEAALKDEPFVDSATAILNRLTERIPRAEHGFRLLFSDQPFEGAERLELVDTARADSRGGHRLAGLWTQYRWERGQLVGDLCPNLLVFFDEPPQTLWARAEEARRGWNSH